jgi:hypothetical protein
MSSKPRNGFWSAPGITRAGMETFSRRVRRGRRCRAERLSSPIVLKSAVRHRAHAGGGMMGRFLFHRAASGIVLVALIFATVAIFANSHALATGKWVNNSVTVRFNPTSFNSTNLPGTALSALDANRLIAGAMNTWKERTGANVNFTYGGDTTVIPLDCPNVNGQRDGINEVAALPGCAPGQVPPNCFKVATTALYTVQAGSNIIEADICVYGTGGVNGTNGTWFVTAASPPPTATDLVGTLTHEFGHVLGMDHLANTVMDTAGLGPGQTRARFQFGADYNLILQKYNTVNQHYFARSLPDSSTTAWSTEKLGTFTTYMNVNSSIGYSNQTGQDSIIVSAMSSENAWFVRHKEDTTIAKEIQHFISGSSTIRAPGITGSDGGKWVGAWVRKQTTSTSCPDINIAWSTDDFISLGGTVDLTGDCTIHDPMLGYSGGQGLFVLIYTRRSAVPSEDNIVMYRTASYLTPTSWSPARSLGVVSLDAPSLSCPHYPDMECMVTYLEGDNGNAPHFVTLKVTIDATGLLTPISSLQSIDFYWKAVPGGLRDTSGFVRQFAILDNFTSDVMNSELNGSYQIFSDVESSMPLVLNNWAFTGATAFHRAALAADWFNAGNPMFTFYTR